MLQLLLQVLLLHTVAGRQISAREYFSRLVQVSVVEEVEGDKVEVLAGPLHLHLERAAGNQLLRKVLAQEVSIWLPWHHLEPFLKASLVPSPVSPSVRQYVTH